MNTRRILTRNIGEPGRNATRRDLEVYTQACRISDAPKIELLIVVRIEYLFSIDMEKAGSETNVLWMGGTVERVSDGAWLMTGEKIKCYK